MCIVEHLELYEKVLKQSVYMLVIGLKLIHYFCNDYIMKLMILMMSLTILWIILVIRVLIRIRGLE